MNKLYRKKDIHKNLEAAGFKPLDVLVVGSTGAGKSSTINALWGEEVAKIGRHCEPETLNIRSIKLNELICFWDSPGLGDNVTNDARYLKKLVDLLYKEYSLDNSTYGWIDIVLVILDGSGRDMGTTYRILNEAIIPNFQTDRILVAINQADLAMKGRHWNDRKNCPDSTLLNFLEKKAASVCSRLLEATGVTISKPVYYSAERGYNIEKLLDMIIDNMPKTKRQLMSNL